jgi:8-oxo-dGTP pyrophosphatase MutT (NUDIX family)
MEIERYQAAGGIVIEDGKVLLLRKLEENVVVLPKGHIDPGETPEQTAIRETIEETGFTHLAILADLGMLQSQFPRANKWFIRDEYYFVLKLLSQERGPVGEYDDLEHDQATFQRFWAPVDEAEVLMSFEPARTFVRRAVDWWKGQQG